MAPSRSADKTTETNNTADPDWRKTALVVYSKPDTTAHSSSYAASLKVSSLGALLTYGAGLLALGFGLGCTFSPETFDTSEDGTCLGIDTETLGLVSGVVGAGILGLTYRSTGGKGGGSSSAGEVRETVAEKRARFASMTSG